MGRTMKRVPMDFDWPLGRIWKGFLNPYEGCDCPWCYDEWQHSSYGCTKEAQEYKKLWETTSEGSPSSPVFATFGELCEWCAENATTFANYKATKEEWAQMLNDDFVCHQAGNVIMM